MFYLFNDALNTFIYGYMASENVLSAWLNKTFPSFLQSPECIGHIKHFMTMYVTNSIQDFVKCCIKNWVHLDL